MPVAISPSKQLPSRESAKRHAGVIVAEEPGERVVGDSRAIPVAPLASKAAAAASIGRGRLDRLLVERQRRRIGPAEAVAADRAEGAARAGLLLAPASRA